ncbi:MAG: aquaporin family protein [Planctomycetaceae bacterium]|nr:aquaporin family protein [Planctomycetaceae bacterium]
MEAYLGEFLGTMILVFLGNSVVANVVLKGTKGHGSGWTVIVLGWMVAVMVPVMMFGAMSGAHFNPAVTLGMAMRNNFAWATVPGYIGCQMAGGVVGGILVFIFYRPHFNVTEDKDAKLAVFCTAPAIRSPIDNLISEFMATFLLIFAILGAVAYAPPGAVPGPIAVAAIILAMGTALGGTTGYAMNPARDLSPRIAYWLCPIKDKRDADWGYSWIPVVGPLLGGLAAGLAGKAVFTAFLL